MYTLLDHYEGPTPLAELVALVDRLKPSGEGQWSSHNRSDTVTKLFQPLLKDTFPGRWKFAFVNILYPMAVLHPHADGALTPGVRRLHLVLSTTEFSWCWHDGEWQRLEVGGVYTLDPSLLHYAVNLGDKPRIHLIVDLEEES